MIDTFVKLFSSYLSDMVPETLEGETPLDKLINQSTGYVKDFFDKNGPNDDSIDILISKVWNEYDNHSDRISDTDKKIVNESLFTLKAQSRWLERECLLFNLSRYMNAWKEIFSVWIKYGLFEVLDNEYRKAA